MNAPRFSITLPVYNGARYLEQAIQSVLDQTFEDFELIIWDDASTDQSRQIARSFEDSRIRVSVNEQNRGLFPTLNLAARASRGELIRLLAQDDVLKPSCLESEDRFWRDNPDLGMSYCQVETIDGEGRLLRGPKDDQTPARVSPELATQISFYHGSMPGNISPVVLSRTVLFEVGLFREDLELAGDFELWTRICQRYVTGFIRRPLLSLRTHSAQLSRSDGAYPQFMRETRAIVDRLIARMPGDLQPYAHRYNRWHRHVLYTHHLIRSLMTGNFRDARATYRFLRHVDSVPLAFFRWVVTGGNRFFRPSPRFQVNETLLG